MLKFNLRIELIQVITFGIRLVIDVVCYYFKPYTKLPIDIPYKPKYFLVPECRDDFNIKCSVHFKGIRKKSYIRKLIAFDRNPILYFNVFFKELSPY